MLTHGEQTRNESYRTEQPVLPNKRALVLEFVRARGRTGATIEEVADGTGLSVQCVCGRKGELECPVVNNEKRPDLALIQTTSQTRVGRSGKRHHVFVAKEFSAKEPSHPVTAQIADHKASQPTKQLELF